MKLFGKKPIPHPLADVLPRPDANHLTSIQEHKDGTHDHGVKGTHGDHEYVSNVRCKQFTTFFNTPADYDRNEYGVSTFRYFNPDRLDKATSFPIIAFLIYKAWDDTAEAAAKHDVDRLELLEVQAQLRNLALLSVRLRDRYSRALTARDQDLLAGQRSLVDQLQGALRTERARVDTWDRQAALEGVEREEANTEALLLEVSRKQEDSKIARQVSLDVYRAGPSAPNSSLER
jgi:hypothetical protein